jgi:hypothetical protein
MVGDAIARRDIRGGAARTNASAGPATRTTSFSGASVRQVFEAASRGGLLLFGAAATWLAGFVLATAPEISITCGLRLGANHRDSRDRKDWKPAWKSVRRRLRHDELAFSSFCLRAWSGLAQAAWGGDGLLGRRPRGAARAIPGPYERRAEHRAVS